MTLLHDFLSCGFRISTSHCCDPVIVELIPTLTVKVDPTVGSTLADVTVAIGTAFENDYILGTTTVIGTSKRHSDQVSLIENIAAVDYLYLSLVVTQDLNISAESAYDWEVTLTALDVLEESVEVYDNSTLIAIDDGVGGWTTQASGESFDGSISYTTGVLLLDLNGYTPSGTMSVRYQQDESGDIVATKNQILKLNDVNISDITFSN